MLPSASDYRIHPGEFSHSIIEPIARGAHQNGPVVGMALSVVNLKEIRDGGCIFLILTNNK